MAVPLVVSRGGCAAGSGASLVNGLVSPVLTSDSVRALAGCAASTGPLGTTAAAALTGPAGSACYAHW